MPADIVVDRLGRTEPCPICLVAPELDNALIEVGCLGGCGPFHAECLQNWLYQQRTCPLCRYALPRANRQSQPTR